MSLATTKGFDMLDIIIVFTFVLMVTGLALFIADIIATICNDYFNGE